MKTTSRYTPGLLAAAISIISTGSVYAGGIFVDTQNGAGTGNAFAGSAAVADVGAGGGWFTVRLARRVGSTPFYAYDRRLLSARVAHVRAHLPQAVELHFSMKANPMPALVQHMAGLVDGIDVASGGELKVALDTGMAPERISFAGPGKSDAELTRAVAAGAVVSILPVLALFIGLQRYILPSASGDAVKG